MKPATPPPLSHVSSQVARLVLAVLPPLSRQLSRDLRDRGAISVERFKALRALEGGPMRSGALATRLLLSPAALTRLADGLVADHLVVRIDDEADRRTVRLALTDTGRAELIRGEGIVMEALEDILRALTPVARARLAAALEDLRGALEPDSGAVHPINRTRVDTE